MSLNLATGRVFPVVTATGDRRCLRFADLFAQSSEDTDPVVDFDWPRADLNIASYEFAIGVLAVAKPFHTAMEWFSAFQQGLTPDQIDALLEPLLPAFNLTADGDAPRFMQSFEPLAVKVPNPIEALFIDTPGENTRKKNVDLLTHRDRFAQLGLPAAALALFALQQFAPSGGAGNRTSMRGGGPMTALLRAQSRDGRPLPLWRTLLLNQQIADPSSPKIDANALETLFPWLAPTKLSDKAHGGREVHGTSEDVHPLQCFFGMPRRIRLVLSTEQGHCDLTGQEGPLVTGFLQEPWGVNYGKWQHPLTPYRRQKEGAEPYTVKPKSGRFGYRDWVGVTLGDGSDKSLAERPKNMAALENRSMFLRKQRVQPALRVAGWAMSNMEAIAYLHQDQPLYLAADAQAQTKLDELAREFARAGDQANSILRQAVKTANFSEGAKVDTESGLFPTVRSNFFGQTESHFHALLAEATEAEADLTPERMDLLRERWRGALFTQALNLFETYAGDPLVSQQIAQRRAQGARSLRMAFAGYGPVGGRLFKALSLPQPTPKKSRKSKEAVDA